MVRMGRTKRKRARNNQHQTHSLDNDASAVGLRQLLKQFDFTDHLKLKLYSYPTTGRGVTSKKPLKPSDVLIKIPFGLLISFDTIATSELIDALKKDIALNIQTLLSLFMVMERHKDVKSPWKRYIDSLPNEEPILPWTCSEEEIYCYPEHLRTIAQVLHENFNECFEKAKMSLSRTVLCVCCGQPLADYLLNFDSFKWGYVLVNTRAVYIDPQCLIYYDNPSFLEDEPALALCPFLDLFNHHFEARTKADVVPEEGKLYYQLTTLTGFKRYEQIFISYGAHNNEKLLMEYGFFIPGNLFDFVRFNFDELLDILKVSVSQKHYKSVKKYEFDDDDLYINHNGASFGLKAILFVVLFPKVLNHVSYVFSNKYPNDFEQVLVNNVRTLLNFKLNIYKNDVENYNNHRKFKQSCGIDVVIEFLNYRVKYVDGLLKLLDENKLCF
ncbi:SET domain-containing protein 4 [Anthonomus grandis grandis]|uniref:SET domain-containing protein 4 n=1 Tax=Anthonomus grandis grandis TaxID=2921223 RepID=UPI0021660232|nr:SET domain-containing protein 4 [Anthonomus grandis grandis]